ncbi:hypothetical protein B0181_07840 [Moraxella caviae]|uniref:Uncharacterized protein n=1 Tax=Moraxella caviae TaxID=34060 RepID=A0A1S9ZYZ8_9GAMM|nr:hypothetical protein [Moraxella caviae]OOR88619.1 hypothetical protein B0181_07840 [Moraxella caviae]STZ13699.1 Uncharacterised protein [Moraxella caviae]
MKDLPTRIFDAFYEGILDTAVFYSSDDAYLYRLDEYRQVFERLAKEQGVCVVYYDFKTAPVDVYPHFMAHLVQIIDPCQSKPYSFLSDVFKTIAQGEQAYFLILDNIEYLYQLADTRPLTGSLRTCLDIYKNNICTSVFCRDRTDFNKLYFSYNEPFYRFGHLIDVADKHP